MLTTFNPSIGPGAGVNYALPPTKDVDVRTHHINRLQTAHQELEESDGVYPSSGTGTLYPSYGEIDVTFKITPNWLIAQGYTGNLAGLETALVDFAQAVIQGGKGTLTDTLPSGTKVGKLGAAAASRTCSAWANSDLSVTRAIGSGTCEIQMTFMVPSGKWTYAGGTIVAWH